MAITFEWHFKEVMTAGKAAHLQVPAPFSTATLAVSERVLMLWACTSQPCANNASSWRAFSCHLPSSVTAHNKPPLSDAESSSQHDNRATSPTKSDGNAQQQPADVQTDSWGTADDSWGACPNDDVNAEQQPGAALDFSDLENALSKTQQQVSTKLSKQHTKDTAKLVHSKHQQQQQQNVSSCCLNLDVARPSMPGFYMHMVTEAAGAPATMSADDQHIADLVAAYQDETHQVHIMSSNSFLRSCIIFTKCKLDAIVHESIY